MPSAEVTRRTLRQYRKYLSKHLADGCRVTGRHGNSCQRSSSFEKTSSAGWYGLISRSRRSGSPKTTADLGALQHLVQSALAARDCRVNGAIDHAIEGREDPLFQILVSVRAERE